MAGEKDVGGSGVIMVDDEEELVVDGERDVVIAVVIPWVYSEAVSYTHLTLPTNREV